MSKFTLAIERAEKEVGRLKSLEHAYSLLNAITATVGCYYGSDSPIIRAIYELQERLLGLQ